MIAIASTDGLGNPLLFNTSPREDDFNFVTLGEQVEGIVRHSGEGVERRLRSGSTDAVRVAVGLLAMFSFMRNSSCS